MTFFDKVGSVDRVTPTGDVKVIFGKAFECTIASEHLVKMRSLLPGDLVKLVDDVRGDGNLKLENGDHHKSATKACGHISLVLENCVKETGEIYATVGQEHYKFRPFHLDFVARPLYGDFMARVTQYACDKRASPCLAENMLTALQQSMQDLPVVDTSACSKSSPYEPGNVVKVSSDVEQFIHWQLRDSSAKTRDPFITKFQTLQDHARLRLCDPANGPFPTEQVVSLLEPGKVADVSSDGDAIVEFKDGRAWSIRPSYLRLIEGSETWDEGASSCSSTELSNGIDSLIHYAQSHGPEELLHTACFSGKMEVITFALKGNVGLECKDKNGNGPLHYAAHGNQPEVINFLLKKKANINATNELCHTALQFAVKKGFLKCVRELIKHQLVLDPNIKDDVGNTALHVAIAKMNADIVNELADLPEVKFTICNQYGLNTLHVAAVKGNSEAAEKILSKMPDLVNVKQGDQGYAALHFAAVKGHYDVVETLLKQALCRVDLPTKHEERALLLAASEGHVNIVESLLLDGADVNSVDSNRNTALHLTLMKINERSAKPPDMPASRAMKAVEEKMLEHGLSEVDRRFLLACLLARSGANLACCNNDGKTPLDILPSDAGLLVKLLKLFHKERRNADSDKCKYCLEVSTNTYFTPCGHYVSCQDCSQRMKHCFTCGTFISARVPAGIPARLGQRVVRGPDWRRDNEDGGDGHVGTVTAIEHSPGDHSESSFSVSVVWDAGYAGNYRANIIGPCDLRLYDSGPVGISFPTVACVPCRKMGIIGTLWKCTVCTDYNLCHSCYMTDKHLLDHAFLRFDAPGTEGIKVPLRQGSIKNEVRGIFEGAKVVRGRNWIGGNQDGGEGSVGTVLRILSPETTTVRSQAIVRWPNADWKNYRLGYQGAVDLKCTEPALGQSFYKDHMPLIAPVDVSRTGVGKSGFRIGEQVLVVAVEADAFQLLQQDHGGWHSTMTQIISNVGTVQRESPEGDVWVYFGPGLKFLINPRVLKTVSMQAGRAAARKLETSPLQHACFIGDVNCVHRLIEDGADLEEVSNENRPIHSAAYGNQPEIMSLLISKGADVNAKNQSNRTALHIAVDKEFVDCVRVLTESASLLDVNIQDQNGCTAIHIAVRKKSEAAIQMLVSVCGANFMIKNSDGSNVLHTAALEGNYFAVEQILSKIPDLINVQKRNGYTALHIAATNGHHHVVKTLLNKGNCTVDLENTKHETALVLAVNRGYCDIVELLVQADANINNPDDKGDTAMHLSLLRRSEVQPQCVKFSTSPAVAEVMQNLRESCEPGADVSLALPCFLASRGADLYQMNKKGQSAITIAKTAAEGALLLKWHNKKW